MSPEVLQTVGSIGGVGGLLALIVLYYARSDAKRHQASWQEQSEAYKALAEQMIAVVKENTAISMQMVETSKAVEASTKELRVEINELRKSKSPAAMDQLQATLGELAVELKAGRRSGGPVGG